MGIYVLHCSMCFGGVGYCRLFPLGCPRLAIDMQQVMETRQRKITPCRDRRAPFPKKNEKEPVKIQI